jgi:hypothetical protein
LSKFVQDLPGLRCGEKLKGFHGPCGTQCLRRDLHQQQLDAAARFQGRLTAQGLAKRWTGAFAS